MGELAELGGDGAREGVVEETQGDQRSYPAQLLWDAAGQAVAVQLPA